MEIKVEQRKTEKVKVQNNNFFSEYTNNKLNHWGNDAWWKQRMSKKLSLEMEKKKKHASDRH